MRNWIAGAAALSLLAAPVGGAFADDRVDARDEARAVAGALVYRASQSALRQGGFSDRLAQRLAVNAVSVVQRGEDNSATIAQAGAGNIAAIRQRGADNSASLVQNGNDNTACVYQFGQGLQTSVAQSGRQSVSYVQTPYGIRNIPVEACVAARLGQLGLYGRR